MKKLILMIFIFVFFLFLCSTVYALDDGEYVIRSAIDRNYVLDINNGFVQSGSNIQLYKSNSSNAQRFKITNLGDETYEISSALDGNYAIDVQNGIFENSSNVRLYSSNKSSAQRWTINNVGNGYYSIASSNEKYCLDVNKAEAKNNSNIQLYVCNNTYAQRFLLDKITIYEKPLNSGIYSIASALSSNKVLDIKNGIIKNYNSIQLYDANGTDAQKWFVNYLGDGYYSIKAYLDINYSMDVYNGSSELGTSLQMFSYNNSNAQKWIIKSEGDDYYSIISACNNLSVDVDKGSITNGTRIQLYKTNGSSAQKFKFSPVKEVGTKSINDGYYFIKTLLNSDKVLDISNGVVGENSNIQIYDLNFSLAQKWYLEYQGGGYYKIISNKNSKYCMEVSDVDSNVQINLCNNKNSQKWIIKKASDDNYYIISENGKYLDLTSASISNGSNVGVITANGSNTQKFNFRKTASGLSSQIIKNGIYRISSSLDNGMVVDLSGATINNETNIQLYKSNGSNAQKWEVSYSSAGYYKISTLLNLTKLFDVAGAGIANGTNVQLYDYNNSIAQQWIIKDIGAGYYNIISNANGLCLDVKNGNAFNGSNIWMYECNNSSAQKFKFVKTQEKTRVVDVSYHQGTIDWDKVYNSGIYGVILRIGYWNTEDGKLAEYINEVKRLGMPYGIYLFSYANTTNGANIEANFTNSIINKYNLNPTLGIYYDLEDWYLSADNTSNTLSKEQYDDIARTYINNVSQYVGSKYKVKIYTDLNHVNNRFGDYARSESDWIAHYGVSSCGYKGPHSLWQYTSEATLDGIRGYVDMNYLY